jgi:Immunity protein Imm1
MVHPSGQQMTVRHITRLSIEDQQAMAADSELVISHPQWRQIEDAIRRLDGKYRTLVILGQENTEFDYIVVGGGKDRLYWCGIYDKEGREFVAVDPSKSSTTYVKVPTGQPTSVPLKETIGLEGALAAAREYAETGQRTTKLAWEERK